MHLAGWIEASGSTVGAIAALVAAVAAVGALRDGKKILRAAQSQVTAAQDQAEAAHLPVLAVEHRAPTPTFASCTINNIGNGPALEITYSANGSGVHHAYKNAIARGQSWEITLPQACTFTVRFRSASGRWYESLGSLMSGIVRQQQQRRIPEPPPPEPAGGS